MLRIKILFAIAALTAVIMVGCSKSESNPVNPGENNSAVSTATVKIDGAGFVNKALNSSSGVAVHIPSEDLTYATFWGANNSDSISVSLIFPGSQNGSFQWNEINSGVALIISSGNVVNVFASDANGSTTVTSYGNIGGKITGKFDGTLYNGSRTDSITISSEFSLVRSNEVEE